MGSPLDYENEFQFQFQLEIVSSGETSQQIENAVVHTKPSHIRTYQNGKLTGFTGARPPDSQDIWGRGGLSATQTPEARIASGDKGLSTVTVYYLEHGRVSRRSGSSRVSRFAGRFHLL
jgi:hypothetical protein